MAQDWPEIKIRAPEGNCDTISDLLFELGALSVTMSDAEDHPIFEPGIGEAPLWPHTEITALFAQDTDTAPILRTLQEMLGDHLPMAAVSLEDQNWIRAWMSSFHAMRFGKRLYICPSTEEVKPEAGAETPVVVSLDPGLAFGTGTHPTTALCLKFLDGFALTDLHVLDYGCGSGILGIAALKLGARSADLLDIDEQALIASSDNARKNAVADRIRTFTDPQKLDPGYDLTLANILMGPLLELEPVLAAHTRGGGTLVLSGILAEQAAEIREAYLKDFVMAEAVLEEGWARLSGTRR